MAEKYRAQNNGQGEDLEKSRKERREDSSTKVAKVAAKGAGQYFAPGVGGKAVDLISQTEAGQQILNRAGKNLARNPLIGHAAETLDDQGMADDLDNAMDMMSGDPMNNVNNEVDNASKTPAAKPTKNSNNNLKKTSNKSSSKPSNVKNAQKSLLNNKNSLLQDFKSDSIGNLILKKIGKKYVIIACGGAFIFLMLMTLIVSGKDMGNLDVTNGSTNIGNNTSSSNSSSSSIVEGKVLGDEPDPSLAIKYWTNYLDVNDFVFPKDDASGISLGAWPKDYETYPKQLTDYKEYNGFIWPTTPTNDTYTYVYEHNGIDILTKFGTPIYSPVDGIMTYSEWGHTSNKGSDETAYSLSINLDSPVTYAGVTIKTVFLTHMCGIRYRCSNCNQRVQKGELLGFAGNAAGTAESVGWAPHLHMTLYGSTYENGVYTSNIEKLYNITSNTVRKAGG